MCGDVWGLGKSTRADSEPSKACQKELIFSEKQTTLEAFSESEATIPSVQCLITIWQLRLWVNTHIYLRCLLWFGKPSSLFQFWAKGISLITHRDLGQRQMDRAQALALDSPGSESRPDLFEFHFLI